MLILKVIFIVFLILLCISGAIEGAKYNSHIRYKERYDDREI